MLKLLNGVDEKTVGYLKANYPQSVAEIKSIAQDLERGIVNFFGLKGEVDKLLVGIDPWTNERWPDDHYKKIYFNPGHAPGDVKFLWEFMKHNFLFSVGKAYKLTGNEDYIAQAIEFIKKWLKSVEDDKGVSWAGHPHICQRMINWLFFLELAEGSSLLTDELREEIEEYLDKQWALLEKEYHSPINNHKLLSLSFVVLHRLYHNRESELDFWLKELKGSSELLFYHDGGFAEQSISYHRLSLESLMLVAQGLKNADLQIPLWLSETIKNSLVYFDAITQPNAKPPVFGDNSDEILIVREWPEEFWDMEYLYAFAQGMGVSSRPATSVPPSMYWLIGLEKAQEQKGLPCKPYRPEKAVFNRVGHFVLRKPNNSFVFFRAGEFGLYVPNASNHPHSHCDQLSLTAFVDGTEILTDPGTYRYNENDYERMIMKDESFHTTVKVNGRPQAEYWSSFAYRNALNATGGLKEGKLYGTMSRDGWQLDREITLKEKELVITDLFKGEGTVEWFFALSPYVSPIKVEPSEVLLKEIGTLRLIKLSISEPVVCQVLPGYASYQYNRPHPSQRLYLSLEIKAEKKMEFVFHALGKESSEAKYR